MPKTMIAGKEVEVDEEGFFLDPSSWDESMAAELANAIGVELTDRHLEIVRFVRSDYSAKGETPTLRRVSTVGGYDIKELFQLFPKKPAKKMSYIAGVPKPHGCV